MYEYVIMIHHVMSYFTGCRDLLHPIHPIRSHRPVTPSAAPAPGEGPAGPSRQRWEQQVFGRVLPSTQQQLVNLFISMYNVYIF